MFEEPTTFILGAGASWHYNYHRAYKVLTERFQYFLQDMERTSGQKINGLIFCDNRNSREDNQAEKFILAVVMVDGDNHEVPYYIRNPFSKEPDWAVSSINLDLEQLLKRAESAA